MSGPLTADRLMARSSRMLALADGALSVKANSVAEVIALDKASPGKLNYASLGSGTTGKGVEAGEPGLLDGVVQDHQCVVQLMA